MYQFISLGGWCGVRQALDGLNITSSEPHNIFDHIRSSSKGVVDCIKHNFRSFIPEKVEVDTRYINWKPYIAEHFGFYHSGDLTSKEQLASFDRKKQRFFDYLQNSSIKTIFIRTCVIPDYMEELEDMKELSQYLKHTFPSLTFKILFIVQGQPSTAYYKSVDDILVFTINDLPCIFENSPLYYKPIIDVILSNNIFDIELVQSDNIEIVPPGLHLCEVDRLPAVNYFGKFIR